MNISFGHPWHHLPRDEVVRRLEGDAERGLDPAESTRRRDEFGPNVLPTRRGDPLWLRFLMQFHQPLVYILLVSAAVTLALAEFVDSAVILGVVLVNAIVGFLQEEKAVQALHALSRAMTMQAMVVRPTGNRRIPSSELVPGDVVVLQSGDKVPADVRLLRVRDLRVDESALTGESLPVEKTAAALPEETPLPDRRNMAYFSSLVTYGQGTGIVVATGERTEVGHIAELVAGAETLSTPLTRKLARFSRLLLWLILALAAATFAVGVWRGESKVEMFMAAVALAVGAIPEGLPAAVTITLAIGVARMARRGAVIRKLPAVETLGGTTVICSDKTGTLTENQMTVQEIWAGGMEYSVSGVGYAPHGSIDAARGAAEPGANAALTACLTAGLLCNDSTLAFEEGRWELHGDPTEGALVAVAAKAGLDARQAAGRLPRLDSIPFESQHPVLATLHDAGEGRPRIVFVKEPLGDPLPLPCAPVGGRDRDPARRRRGAQAVRVHGVPRTACAGLRARRARPACGGSHSPRRRVRPDARRPAGHDRPAASGGHRRREGMPPGRGPGQDDHRRPRGHRRRHREEDRTSRGERRLLTGGAARRAARRAAGGRAAEAADRGFVFARVTRNRSCAWSAPCRRGTRSWP
jgi:Ca2+-transporting ATPase